MDRKGEMKLSPKVLVRSLCGRSLPNSNFNIYDAEGFSYNQGGRVCVTKNSSMVNWLNKYLPRTNPLHCF